MKQPSGGRREAVRSSDDDAVCVRHMEAENTQRKAANKRARQKEKVIKPAACEPYVCFYTGTVISLSYFYCIW